MNGSMNDGMVKRREKKQNKEKEWIANCLPREAEEVNFFF